ncbi:MAG: hypothetical protein ABIQ70_00575 [Dokdonella sp.]
MRGRCNFGLNRAVTSDRCAACPRSTDRPYQRRLIAGSLAIACVMATLISADARAQTCPAPLPWPTDATSLVGNTCFGSQIADTLCGGKVANPGLNVIYRIYISGNASEINSMGFVLSPVMYLSDEAHGCDSSPCLRSGSWISLAGLSAGYYHLIVAHDDLDAGGTCGQFTLSADAPLSVSDTYFENGFD